MPKNQTEFKVPGMDRDSIPQIEQATEPYINVRDRWMKLGEEVLQLRQALVAAVQANVKKLGKPNGKGQLFYRLDEELVVVLSPGKDKVAVKHVESEEEDE